MSLPGKYNFTIQRGVDFSRNFVKKDQTTGIALTHSGLKARCQFRSLAGQFGTTTTTTLLLALADGAGISIDATDIDVTLDLTVAQTLTLCPNNIKTKVAYGIELYDDSGPTETVEAFLQGVMTINPETPR